ncbi:flagellar filament capping protein FliD [Pseudomonas sp. ADAK18]|uniref:flagellar filament capping protein FliD n=1 Tax=Pseudomonas sp. ADAK18 TaxID=2730848 RepID=UPI0014641358|nr:flagellar filament capping protein FliD [Pseudomonas sp. ADAK18]QJI27930.1 flagellar filament capping protein FliD [Pseudomonas sp. ADAK18]
MAGPTISGPGSNIDTQKIVASLVAAEKAPKQTAINDQTLKATTQLSSIGKIQAALDAFRGAIDNMSKNTSFSGLSASSSDEKVATVTMGAGAASGSYSLIVTQLATASKVATQTYKDGNKTVVNNGTSPTTLTITQSGKEYDLSIPAGSTLQQVRDSLNTQFASAGLSANILTDSNGSRLVVTSTSTGVGTDLTLSGNSGLDVGSSVVGPAPQNAKYILDGSAQESTSNTLTEAISGVSIKLLAESPKTTTTPSGPITSTISVAASNATLKSSVKGFTDSYNALMKAINTETQTTKNPDNTITAAALTGDASVRSLMTSVRNELNALSGSGTLKSLASFGITTDQQTGLLSIDDKKWDAALKTNATDINTIFTGDSGLLTRLTKATDSFALSRTGVFAQRSTTLSDSLTDLKKQQDALDERIAGLQLSLTAKYTAMDSLVAQLNAQSSSIMTTLNALNNPKSN